MAAALEKNPSSLKKLVKDPEIIRSSASLNKRVASLKKDEISNLRQIFAKNRAKANQFDAGIKLIENAMTGAVAVGVVTLLILALLTVVSATK
ncbi:Hypothetical protein PHPALM_17175 [Phytophthora palmivora]|uniref:Uncharacterized protein n=1 Tax=Phytophthora palmivora TaxID=4796 RepID=A0A2P4XMV3_9STRA|nr:Hypothetical protein PHPALM_17175 [Phytophthora palmivora]